MVAFLMPILALSQSEPSPNKNNQFIVGAIYPNDSGVSYILQVYY